jgi:hypothetical protein
VKHWHPAYNENLFKRTLFQLLGFTFPKLNAKLGKEAEKKKSDRED